MADVLDDILEKISEGLSSQHSNVRQGDKSVTYRSVDEIREAVKVSNQLKDGAQTIVRARPRRPKL